MKKEKYYTNNKLNIGAIIFAGLIFNIAVGFVLYSHIKYVKNKTADPITPVEPVKTYSEISEEEGLNRLQLISNDFKDSFESENKPIDVSFKFDMQTTENYTTTSLSGYLIRKESTLDNNFYLYGRGNGEIVEMYYLNSGLNTYEIERTKESMSSPWVIDKYEVTNYVTAQEAFEKVGNGNLGYVILLVLSAGPGLSNTAESMLENRVENELTSEKFESTGDLGNLRYSYSYQDEDELISGMVEYNNYRLTHFEYDSKEENKSPDKVTYNFEWTDDIEIKTIPNNK